MPPLRAPLVRSGAECARGGAGAVGGVGPARPLPRPLSPRQRHLHHGHHVRRRHAVQARVKTPTQLIS